MTRTAEEPRLACLNHGASRRRPGLLIAATGLLLTVGALGCGSSAGGDADDGKVGGKRDGGACRTSKTTKQRVSDAGAQRTDAGAAMQPRDAGTPPAPPAKEDAGAPSPAADDTPSATGSGTAQTLLEEDFESPSKPIALNCGKLLNQEQINTIYGRQGFTYQQNFTIESVLLKDNQGDYRDEKEKGGKYAVGMMSDGQDDLLALTFKPNQKYLNVALDLASVELRDCEVNIAAEEPRLNLTLYKTPATGFTFANRGERLQEVALRGRMGRNARTFEWTRVVGAFEASRAAGESVTLVFDAAAGGYVVFDNLIIAESPQKFDVNVPGGTSGGDDDSGDDDSGDDDDCE